MPLWCLLVAMAVYYVFNRNRDKSHWVPKSPCATRVWGVYDTIQYIIKKNVWLRHYRFYASYFCHEKALQSIHLCSLLQYFNGENCSVLNYFFPCYVDTEYFITWLFDWCRLFCVVWVLTVRTWQVLVKVSYRVFPNLRYFKFIMVNLLKHEPLKL